MLQLSDICELCDQELMIYQIVFDLDLMETRESQEGQRLKLWF